MAVEITPHPSWVADLDATLEPSRQAILDTPVITFWAVTPDPRDDISTFRTWGEMLATHEFAHIERYRGVRAELTASGLTAFWQRHGAGLTVRGDFDVGDLGDPARRAGCLRAVAPPAGRR